MKVLFFRYKSICEPDIIDAFKELGVEVIEFGLDIEDKSLISKEIINKLSKKLMDTPVDIVFSINFFPSVSDVCNVFHIRYFSWTVDSPVMNLFTKQIKNEWNRTFVFDRAQYNDIIQYNEGRIFHLPLAANINGKQNVINTADNNKKNRFTHNISFVGSLYTEKNPFDDVKELDDYTRGILDGIISAQEKVYGYYFIDELLTDEIINNYKKCCKDFYSQSGLESFLTDSITFSQLYIGNKITERERYHLFKYLSDKMDVNIYTYGETKHMPNIKNMGTCDSLFEMPVVFNNSKVNINTTSKAIRSGVPLRVFDILACGGFLISNYQTEIPEIFEIGKDLIVYSSIEECAELCDYYLNHESERKEVAQAGFETVKNNHTYTIRLAQMLKIGII